MKAKNYSDKVLLLPKEPVASMLFLEFVRDYNKLNKVPVSFTIQDFDVWNNSFDELFLINVNETVDWEFCFKAVEYINANF